MFWSRSTDPAEQFSVRSDKTLPAGKSTLKMRHETTRPGAPAEIVLSSGGAEFARLKLQTNLLFPAGNGEMTDIGLDRGSTVTDYNTPGGRIEGDIPHVRIDFD